jgi:hypothetical protein
MGEFRIMAARVWDQTAKQNFGKASAGGNET